MQLVVGVQRSRGFYFVVFPKKDCGNILYDCSGCGENTWCQRLHVANSEASLSPRYSLSEIY